MAPSMDIDTLTNKVGAVPDFPQPGIIFRDITTLLADAESFTATIDHLADRLSPDAAAIDALAGIESRGFLFAAALGYKLGLPVLTVRKPGKLPRPTISVDYELEYGTDQLQLHADDADPGANVVVVDDLIATGGTAAAAVELLRSAGAVVDRALFVIGLVDLPGLDRLGELDIETHHLIGFDGH